MDAYVMQKWLSIVNQVSHEIQYIETEKII